MDKGEAIGGGVEVDGDGNNGMGEGEGEGGGSGTERVETEDAGLTLGAAPFSL